jgi:SET domain-containing protein
MERTAPPPEVWADDRVEVRGSLIEGRGLFANGDIAAGTVVLRLGGRLVTTSELLALFAANEDDPDAVYIDTITVDDDAHLVMQPSSVAHFGNHSCDPTLWHAGPYAVVTRRDVVAGDELTVDYGASSGADGFAMDCNCGSPLCRGQITSDDWRLPELRARYSGHWTPALERRIAGS